MSQFGRTVGSRDAIIARRSHANSLTKGADTSAVRADHQQAISYGLSPLDLPRAGYRSIAGLAALTPSQTANAQSVKHMFVIATENHNWTQPSSYTALNQVYGNPAAPFINSLVTPGNANAAQSSAGLLLRTLSLLVDLAPGHGGGL